MAELFRTIHGSHLYGLNHEDSDTDIFIVTDSTKKSAQHKVTDEYDYSTRGLGWFMHQAFSGSHQSVEAMFSPYIEYSKEGEKYRSMIESVRINGPDVIEKYERTIKAFCFGNLKKRRHAIRLNINLYQLKTIGRFNPRLSEQEIDIINLYSTYEDEELLKFLI